MANKIILALMLALVLGFAVTSVVAFSEAASIYDDASDLLSSRMEAAPTLEAQSDASPTVVLVAQR